MAALAKILSSTGTARSLDLADPVVGVRFRYLILGVGLSEMVIAFFCLFTPRTWFSLAAIAWVSSLFCLYRAALWSLGWHRPCACLGSFTEVLGIPQRTADAIMKGILAYLVVGSYCFLLIGWTRYRSERRLAAVDPVSGAAAG